MQQPSAAAQVSVSEQAGPLAHQADLKTLGLTMPKRDLHLDEQHSKVEWIFKGRLPRLAFFAQQSLPSWPVLGIDLTRRVRPKQATMDSGGMAKGIYENITSMARDHTKHTILFPIPQPILHADILTNRHKNCCPLSPICPPSKTCTLATRAWTPFPSVTCKHAECANRTFRNWTS